MPSSSDNGSYRTESLEFSNIGLGSEPPTPDYRPPSASGPWTNPPDAYSPKVQSRESPEERRKLPKQSYFLLGAACVVVFVIGIGLGIVIGHFAITKAVGKSARSISAQESVNQMPTCQCITAPTTPPQNTSESPTPFCPECPQVPSSCVQCSNKRNPVETVGDEAEKSLFMPLTPEEINSVKNFLITNGYISLYERFGNSRLLNMLLYPVNKTQALDYLDNGGPFPGRYALATVARSSLPEPDVMEYKIGPLGESTMTTEELRMEGEMAFSRRPFDYVEFGALVSLVRPHIHAIAHLLRESFDGASLNDGISMKPSLEPARNMSDRVSLLHVYLSLPSGTVLHLLPVTCYIHHPGTDQSKWYASEFYYLSQGPYSSGQELQTAYNNGLLRKIALPQNYRQHHRHDYDLVQNVSLPQRPYSNLPPPVLEQPAGPRYTVKGGNIQYMDWQFEVTSNPLRGPAIFDVRFKGDRIAYEISLQDVTLIYAKQSNGAAPSVLTDTHFFLGNYHNPRLGLDCPKGATTLDVSIYMFAKTRTRTAMCLFEATAQRPLWRHGRYGQVEHFLVLRAPMNLGNYDYSLEWQFHVDGSIQTVISASGYLYGAFFNPDDPLVDSDKSTTPFGYRLSDYVLGPIHDHTFSFKVDLDVLGVENSFQTTHWKTGDALTALQTQTNVTEAPDYFHYKTRYLEHEFLETENGFVSDPRHPKIWTVLNEKKRNHWGALRGYRLISQSTAAETFKEHVMMSAWDHLKYTLAVTKRKEDEQFATESLYDMTHPLQALRGLGRMMDSESCRGSDLVLWVSEKFMHAPTAEDLPMTLQVHRGFTLKPFNYFDRTSTFDLKGYYNQGDEPSYSHCPP